MRGVAEKALRDTAGTRSAAAKPEAMNECTTVTEKLERLLLRRSVGALEAGRERCADCGRTPLAGEEVHVYGGRRRKRVVCELCRVARRGAPLASEVVRHAEHGQTVRLTARAA